MGKTGASDPFLRLIALFKLAKALLFVCAGVGLLHFLNQDVQARLQHLMNNLHVDPGSHLLQPVLDEAGRLTNTKLAGLSAIAFFYAALFATEGTGLYLRKRWAEWFVVIMTGSLLPLEIYELVHKPSGLKVLLIIGNLLILGYLVYVIRRKEKT